LLLLLLLLLLFVQVVSECGPCDGSNEQCRDTYCSCIDGYFRVFGQCRPYSAEFAVEDNTTATIAASMTVLALCLVSDRISRRLIIVLLCFQFRSLCSCRFALPPR
jgi:hypothetical protein